MAHRLTGRFIVGPDCPWPAPELRLAVFEADAAAPLIDITAAIRRRAHTP
jgi:hypothetical protein